MATTPITLPAVLLVLLITALAALAWPYARRHHWRRRGSSSVDQLNDLQIRMLAVYRLLSRRWMHLSFFENAFNDHHPFRVQQALDELVDLEYLDAKNSPDSEYHLTPLGRDVSLEIDMVARGLVVPDQSEDGQEGDDR